MFPDGSLLPKDTCRLDMKSDGNFLPRAIESTDQNISASDDIALSRRLIIAMTMAEHPNLEISKDFVLHQAIENDPETSNFKEYIETMSTSTRYCSEPEMIMHTHMTKDQIHVFRQDNDGYRRYLKFGESNFGGQTILLVFNFEHKHYDRIYHDNVKEIDSNINTAISPFSDQILQPKLHQAFPLEDSSSLGDHLHLGNSLPLKAPLPPGVGFWNGVSAVVPPPLPSEYISAIGAASDEHHSNFTTASDSLNSESPNSCKFNSYFNKFLSSYLILVFLFFFLSCFTITISLCRPFSPS
jgi:hypothetical protein